MRLGRLWGRIKPITSTIFLFSRSQPRLKTASATIVALGFLGAGFNQVDCKKSWPVLKRDEIEQHSSEQNGVWIVVGNSVYDMTHFVPQHPGGKEKILQAAGGQVESFWNVYRQHYTESVTILLRKYKIGEIDASEWPKDQEPQSDPYVTDPPRSSKLVFHSVTPCNAEPPPESVAESFITPNELFFIRNHSPVPNLTEDNFRLVVAGRSGQVLLSFDSFFSLRLFLFLLLPLYLILPYPYCLFCSGRSHLHFGAAEDRVSQDRASGRDSVWRQSAPRPERGGGATSMLRNRVGPGSDVQCQMDWDIVARGIIDIYLPPFVLKKKQQKKTSQTNHAGNKNFFSSILQCFISTCFTGARLLWVESWLH